MLKGTVCGGKECKRTLASKYVVQAKCLSQSIIEYCKFAQFTVFERVDPPYEFVADLSALTALALLTPMASDSIIATAANCLCFDIILYMLLVIADEPISSTLFFGM